jgi:hypothetical protein
MYFFRRKLASRGTQLLLAMAITYGIALVLVFPFILDLREILASRFVPYVTSLRFGDTGFLIIWSVVSLAIAVLLIALFVLGSVRKN